MTARERIAKGISADTGELAAQLAKIAFYANDCYGKPEAELARAIKQELVMRYPKRRPAKKP